MAVLSRRELLVGGAAAVAAIGVGGAVELGARRRTSVLHRIGLANSPDRSVARAHTSIVSGSFGSAHMRSPVGWSLSVPAGDVTGVIYCLHGRGGDHRSAFDQIHLPDFVAAAGAKLAVAAVDGGADSYWHPRADGTDSRSMLLDEFIPMVDARLGVTRRAILGWSMGGYGALLAAETDPARFKVVAATSPALWTSARSTAPGAFDDAADYTRHDVFAGSPRLASVVVRVDCGTGDPFYPAAKQFASQLRPPVQGGFTHGFHDSAYWRSVAPAQVATISAALAAN